MNSTGFILVNPYSCLPIRILERQRLPATPKLSLCLKAPGMDTRPGELVVMRIPWGVAPRAPVQGR
jgi:hypothetical protein